MFTLKIQNTNGDIWELTHNSNYHVKSVQGLTPPPTVVNTATAGTIDGSFHNSSRVEQRNIVITLVPNGDIEANRQLLYSMFPRKTKCTIYFKNKYRNVKIDGYVETLESDIFSMREEVQISIICPRPFFEDLAFIYKEISSVVALFEFPFSIANPIPFSELLEIPQLKINNVGDVNCGTLIDVYCYDTVEGLKIINTTTSEYFELNYTFANNDHIIINTNSGQMGAKLIRSGETTNLLNYVTQGSKWFKIIPGINIFTYTLTTGTDASLKVYFTTSLMYGGV